MKPYRPEGWKNPFLKGAITVHGRDGKPISHNEAFEYGADAMLEFVLSICRNEEHHNGYDKGTVFAYGGPSSCEYECFRGLTTILEGKAKRDTHNQWVFIPDEEEK